MAKKLTSHNKHVNTSKASIAANEELLATLAARVRVMRMRRGLTQVELAKAADMSQPALSLIEVGETRWLRGHTLMRLAGALDVNPKWLEGGPAQGENHVGLDAEERQLLELWRALDANHRRAWLAAGQAFLVAQTGAGRRERRTPAGSITTRKKL
jgi:transcriptional regulator with XRE-family HTH domain